MGRILAIGDIHTKIWIIEKVAKVVNDYDKVIFCGDYADDFSATPQDTLNTWRILRDLQSNNRKKIDLVIGNHDYIYDNDTPSLQSGYNLITQVLIDAPENKNIKAWLTGLPVIIETDREYTLTTCNNVSIIETIDLTTSRSVHGLYLI